MSTSWHGMSLNVTRVRKQHSTIIQLYITCTRISYNQTTFLFNLPRIISIETEIQAQNNFYDQYLQHHAELTHQILILDRSTSGMPR